MDGSYVDTGYIATTFQYRIGYRESSAGIVPAQDLVTHADRDKQYKRLSVMIGNTPLLLTEVRNGCPIITKWESANPTETHYDRAYLALLHELETRGVIRPGDELIEITSGSAGTSIAWLASRLGYKATIIVPSELPNARVQEMINFGAQVIRSDPGYVAQAAEAIRARIVGYKQDGYDVCYLADEDFNNVVTAEKDGVRACFVNHSEHQITVKAFEAIGKEIIRVLNGISLDNFVSVLGNWTSTTGITRALRTAYPHIRVTGIEDERAPLYYRVKNGLPIDPDEIFLPHDSYGSSAPNVRLRFDDVNFVDAIELISPNDRNVVRDSFNGQHLVGARSIVETLGNTSAGALLHARKIADAAHRPHTILAVAYDLIDRYGEPVLQSASANSPVESSIAHPARVDIRPHSQRTHIMHNGFTQRSVGNIFELPSSRISRDAGGLTRPFVT